VILATAFLGSKNHIFPPKLLFAKQFSKRKLPCNKITKMESKIKNSFFDKPIESILKVAVLAVILVWSYQIIKPFIFLMVWSLVISVALYPMHIKLKNKLGGKNILSSVIITLLLLILITLPISFLIEEVISNFIEITSSLGNQQIDLPPPSERVKEIAFVGDYIWSYWNKISENLEAFLSEHVGEIEKLGLFLFGSVAVAGKGLFLFIAAVFLSGVILVYAANGRKFAGKLGQKLAGDQRGLDLALLAETTVRSVVGGVLGLAIIQTFLVGIGLFIADIPFWGLLTMLTLFLSLIQIGATPVLVGVLVFLFLKGDNSTAAIFIVWNVIVIIIDSVIKPFLLGRGVKVPMAVIFLGSLGGFIKIGFLGLFLGPVVLALSYELLTAWINSNENKNENQNPENPEIAPTPEE